MTQRANKTRSVIGLLDLTLDSAAELRKAANGQSFDFEPINSLADELKKIGDATELRQGLAFFPSALSDSMSGVYRECHKGAHGNAEAVKDFVIDVAHKLRAFPRKVDQKQARELVSYCLALHSQLAGDLSATQLRRYSRKATSLSIRSA